MKPGFSAFFAAALFCGSALGEDPLHIWAGGVTVESIDHWVDARLAAANRAIDRLTGVTGPPTIENTLAPYDEALEQLGAAASGAGLLNTVHRDKVVRDEAQKLTQKVSSAFTDLNLNQKVYAALTALDVSHAEPATRHYVERALLEYRLAGVDKDDATRARLHQLQDKMTELILTFNRNVSESADTIKAEKSEMAGLPDDYLASHPVAANGSVTIGTSSPDVDPILSYAKSEDLRRRILVAYDNRGYPANKQVLLDLIATRSQVAKVLGYANWAELAAADQMIGSAANVRKLLNDVDVASPDAARREFSMVLAYAKKSQPGLQSISMAGRSYWEGQYRRATLAFDSQSVRPYFPYDRVEQGILDVAGRLFHVRFQANKTAPVWDASVTALDVYDGDRLAGRIYLDMHPRPGKDQWFSMSQILAGIRGKQLPEGTLVCNFPGGTVGDAGLMQYEDVVTFFHEFGHLMHHILGGNQQWAGVSGIATEGDFAEAPSQMLEEIFHDAGVLQTFARHYQTNETLPSSLIEKMNHASVFGRATWVQRQLFYTTYSVDLHDRAPDKVDLDALQRADNERFSPYTYIENHFYANFTHLTGYSSNYYTYLLDKLIAIDFFSQFDKSNLLDGPTALRYRNAVLAPGGAKPATQLVKDFLGRPQSIDALKAWMNEAFAPAQ
jgi:thimet oligopeptidase